MINFKDLETHINRLKTNQSHIQYFMDLVNKIDLEEGRLILEEVLDFAEREQLQFIYAKAAHRLGWIYLELMQFRKSVNYHKIAYKNFIETEDARGVMSSCNGLMTAYGTQEKWDSAIEWGLRGMELADNHGNEQVLAILMLNIANIYNELKQYKKSNEMLEQVNKLIDCLDSQDDIRKKRAYKYGLYALNEVVLNHREKALKYIEKAYELIREGGRLERTKILNIRGIVYTKLKRYDLAKESFKEAFEEAKSNNHSHYVVANLIEWAELELAQNRYEAAIEKLLRAEKQIEAFQRGYIKKELKLIYFNLSQAFKELGKEEEHARYIKKYFKLKEGMKKNQSEMSIVKLNYKKAKTEAKIYKALYNQIELLSSIGQKITSTLKMEHVITIIAQEIQYLIHMDCFSIRLYDETKKSWSVY